MEIALPQPAWKTLWQTRPEGVRSLENWLLCWILLPNFGYWMLWLIGGPPRGLPILVTGFAGMVVHRASFPLKLVVFVAAMIFSGLCFVAALFNLSVLSLVESLKFAAELNPAVSVEYLVVAAGVVATLAVAWRLLQRPTVIVHPRRFLLVGALVFIAASLDVTMAQGRRGSYKRTPDPDAPFTSATYRSGLIPRATGERHVLMVMVEAMGQPSDPAMRQRLIDIWARPEVRARYEVVAGDTLFYGSTTNGEMRELCGRWAEYEEVMQVRDNGCLPAVLARRGYRTQAWHSFNGSFFERTTWYPNIGFQELRFGPQLVESGAAACPGVFPGACDRDVPRQIGTTLRQARQPQFLYWLTVNSHLPVIRSDELHTENCERFDARLDQDYPMTCRLMQLFDETAGALAREISAADFPATDILIVGDHIPPFFDRHHRNQFEPDRVPWILLRPLPRAAPAPIATAS
ncbi:MAG: sulfatase-like hydrolase/transferase [Pseudomonadota bacterium]|nr:sulfatase-like hydrolase/transferase [Pseudomonadota bacterium]